MARAMDDGQACAANGDHIFMIKRYIRRIGRGKPHLFQGLLSDPGILKKEIIVCMEAAGDIMGSFKLLGRKKRVGVTVGMKEPYGNDLLFFDKAYHIPGIIPGINNHSLSCPAADQKIGVQVIGTGHPPEDLNFIRHSG